MHRDYVEKFFGFLHESAMKIVMKICFVTNIFLYFQNFTPIKTYLIIFVRKCLHKSFVSFVEN